jgi:hypothetical protein
MLSSLDLLYLNNFRFSVDLSKDDFEDMSMICTFANVNLSLQEIQRPFKFAKNEIST